MNIIIDLNGNSDAIALTDAEAANKRNFIFKLTVFQSLLQKSYNLLGTLQMTGTADTDLNNHSESKPRFDMSIEELFSGLRRYGVYLIVYSNTDTLLASAHAEGSAELDLIAETIASDQRLKLLDDLTRTLDMAGRTNTNSHFHGMTLRFLVLTGQFTWRTVRSFCRAQRYGNKLPG